jgi:hypothetical protein
MAEHEKDGMLEKLTAAIRDKLAAQTAAVNAEQDAIAAEDKLAALSATGATDAEVDEFVRVARTFSDEHYQNALVAELRRVYHALALRDAAPVEEVAISRDLWLFLKGEAPLDGFWFGEYPIGKPHYWWRSYMKGKPDRPDWARQLPGAELYDRAARYEYLRTLNPMEFAALFDEALHGTNDNFDDLVDRDMKGEKP